MCYNRYDTSELFIGRINLSEIENYNVYQYELKSPFYDIIAIFYNSGSFYRVFKIDLQSLKINDEVKQLEVSDSSTKIVYMEVFLLLIIIDLSCY